MLLVQVFFFSHVLYCDQLTREKNADLYPSRTCVCLSFIRYVLSFALPLGVGVGFGLISVLRPLNTFEVFSGAVSYPNHTVPGQVS